MKWLNIVTLALLIIGGLNWGLVALGILIGGRLGYVIFYKPEYLITFSASAPSSPIKGERKLK